MTCGVPTVATRVGVFKEKIIDDQAGTPIDKGDATGLVEVAHALLFNPETSSLRAACQRGHGEKFQLQKEADALNKTYRSLLQS